MAAASVKEALACGQCLCVSVPWEGVVCGSAWFKLLNTAQHPTSNVSPDPKLLKNASENKGQYFVIQYYA